MRKRMLLIFIALSLVFTMSVSAQRKKKLTDKLRVPVIIECNVRADVYVDGRKAGRTGREIPMSPGKHKISVRADGYDDYNDNIVVKRKMTINARLRARLAKISLEINRRHLGKGKDARRDVVLYIDGKRQRHHTVEVRPGRHEVGIASGGFYFSDTVNVRAGDHLKVSPRFTIDVR